MNLYNSSTLGLASLALCLGAGCATHSADQDAYWRRQSELGGTPTAFVSSPSWPVLNEAPSTDELAKKFERHAK